MKHLMTTIAAVALTATSALADAHMASSEDLIRTRDITGGDIYRMEVTADDSMWADNSVYNGVDAEWNEIGEIEDIVLSKDGQMVGIVAEIGGFLDIGDKHILIPVDNVRLTAVDDETYTYVTNLTDAEIETMEDVDEGFWN